jgi:hypothetical protein
VHKLVERMQSVSQLFEAFVSHNKHNEPSTVVLAAATVSLIWYLVVTFVCILGYTQL